MSDYVDWTMISDDPNNKTARNAVHTWLLAARQVHTDIDLTSFVENIVRGRRVLDIGVVEHSMEYINRPAWRHGRINQAASYCLGIDILAPLVQELNSRGFNVKCADATSEIDLGERFDVVFIGDVIEHVANPMMMLRFAARHLTTGGKLYITTPNPFSRKFCRQFKRDGVMVVNLDHIGWVTPTQAMELGRRAGIRLSAYHLIKKIPPFDLMIKKLIGWKFSPLEYSFPDYLYEFTKQD